MLNKLTMFCTLICFFILNMFLVAGLKAKTVSKINKSVEEKTKLLPKSNELDSETKATICSLFFKTKNSENKIEALDFAVKELKGQLTDLNNNVRSLKSKSERRFQKLSPEELPPSEPFIMSPNFKRPTPYNQENRWRNTKENLGNTKENVVITKNSAEEDLIVFYKNLNPEEKRLYSLMDCGPIFENGNGNDLKNH